MTQLLAEEIIPIFGVPEALLSDRGTNFLSSLVLNLFKLLGTEKLNTTAYHPQFNGMVERFNWTLKGMLRKHAAKFGKQWDRYLPGLLWAYRNTHTSPLERSHLSCCLALICGHQQKQHSCRQLHQKLEWRSLITGRM